jgi:hypothetical protein
MIPGITGSSNLPQDAQIVSDNRDYNMLQLARVGVSRQQDTDITIVTDEGDKVTISYDTELQAGYMIYDSLASTKGDLASSKGEVFGFHASRELTISVEGDLNKQELKDIKKAMKGIERVMKDFLSGNTGHAITDASKMGSLESISSIEASVQLEQSVYLERRSMASVSYSPPEMTGDSGPGVGIRPPENVSNAVDQMSNIIRNSRVKPGKMIKPIQKFFTHLFERLSREGFKDSPILKASRLIESDLLKNIEKA